jgi:cation:H+ antiporter
MPLASPAVQTGFPEAGVTVLFFLLGLLTLIAGAEVLVRGASRLALSFGISPLVVGLTIVALGTSSPELAVSAQSAFAGKTDLAVANVVGSNIFNILGVLGASALVSPNMLTISPSMMVLDIPVMLAVAVACLPIFMTGHSIARWEGGVFLGYYVAYTTWLVLAAKQHDALQTYGSIMISFVLPITLITLVILVVRHLNSGRDGP